jgi:hypothetical protein
VVQRVGKISDGMLWGSLFAVLGLFAGANVVVPNAARTIALVGMSVWFPILAGSIRNTAPGKRAYGGVLAALVVANLAFLVFGPLPPGTVLSLQLILGWLHWPIAFAMGTPVQDCLVVARMLGEKLVLTEFVAYLDLATYLDAARRGVEPALDPRSIVLCSYALSGFANFASIAIQIGGISPMAPSRRHEIARLGLKAMVGGAITSYIVACVAGTFYSGTSMLGL